MDGDYIRYPFQLYLCKICLYQCERWLDTGDDPEKSRAMREYIEKLKSQIREYEERVRNVVHDKMDEDQEL